MLAYLMLFSWFADLLIIMLVKPNVNVGQSFIKPINDVLINKYL